MLSNMLLLRKRKCFFVRLSVIESKNTKSYYVIKSTYENGKHSSKVVEKLGTLSELKQKLNFIEEKEVTQWAKGYINELTLKEKEGNLKVVVEYSPHKLIEKNEQFLYSGGYLFLQRIYKELSLDKICRRITNKYKFEFDLDSILSRLVYGRILFPSSKLCTYKLSKKLIQQPNFKLPEIYRALDVICKEADFLQAELYKNSINIVERDIGVLYYDLTNFFFEIEQADEDEGLRQYGKSKENRPNPITQLGLFMDGSGIPLAFCVERGNKNEQLTLKPLEKKILKDFELSKFVVCTDAGLASKDNRKFNTGGERGFITTQSIKKLIKHLKEWALDPKGWKMSGDIEAPDKIYDITELDNFKTDKEAYKKLKEKIFFKERWINENDFEQRFIVTYSLKYRDYKEKIRAGQIERAEKLIKKGITQLKKVNQNDYRRFVKKISATKEGEVATEDFYSINGDVIAEESKYDGFYGVCTNLEDPVEEIVKANSGRWEIEESFRIMKSEFKARPVHLSLDDRITAHFTTCFLALMIFRLLEKKLHNEFSAYEIIETLRNFSFYKIKGEGFAPAYTRSDLTDALHEAFHFRTDYEILTNKAMKYIYNSKNTTCGN